MVEKSLHTEMLLELVFSVDGSTSEQLILKKSIPLYMRKLNCFFAAVLKITENGFKEQIVIPFVSSKTDDWSKLKSLFDKQRENSANYCHKKKLGGYYYYSYCLHQYGTLILGRKKPFEDTFLHELRPVVNHLGKSLIYANEREVRNNAEKALRVSENRYRSLYENMPDVVCTLDTKGNFIEINQQGIVLFEYSREEILTMSIDQLIYKGDKMNSDSFFDKLKEEGSYAMYEGRSVTKTGKIIWIQVSSTAIFQEGIQIGSQDIVRDITKRKEFEISLKESAEKLRKLNVEKDRFFSIIAHDLRSPFNSLLGLTEIMEEEMHSLTIDQLQRIAGRMRASAVKLFNLLENLLDWARVKQGLIPFNPELISIIQVVKESVATSSETAKSKEIIIVVNIEKGLRVYADNNMLETIIRNLVSNALKFTPIGGHINISAKNNDNKTTLISVKDSGIGMSKDLVNNLFKIDVETNRLGTEKEPSSGLGLILCQEFAENQDGKIYVESEEGKGSTFYLSLPSKA